MLFNSGVPMEERLEAVKSVFVEIYGESVSETFSQESSMDTISGWDSMSFLDLASKLENKFNVKFAPNELAQMFNVENILKILEDKL